MYLLDTNVLIAFAYDDHVSHIRVFNCVKSVQNGRPHMQPFTTCSIVELGFVRIASGPAGFAENLSVARTDLRRVKGALRPHLLADQLDGNRLPEWVTTSKQTTDGHLVELANSHGVRLATLDTGIRGAFLIPEHSDSRSGVREEPRVPYGVEDDDEELIYDEATGRRRLTRCKITGPLVVARRPGQPLVTSEEIKRLLEDFP